MKLSRLLVAIAFLGSLTGCTALDGYERRYSIGYVTKEGERLDAGLTLRPIKPAK